MRCFPEGVPGVTQGIPSELMKGNQQAQPGAAIPLDGISRQMTTSTAAAQPAAEKPKPKAEAEESGADIALRAASDSAAGPQDQPAAARPASASASTAPAAQRQLRLSKAGRLRRNPALLGPTRRRRGRLETVACMSRPVMAGFVPAIHASS